MDLLTISTDESSEEDNASLEEGEFEDHPLRRWKIFENLNIENLDDISDLSDEEIFRDKRDDKVSKSIIYYK